MKSVKHHESVYEFSVLIRNSKVKLGTVGATKLADTFDYILQALVDAVIDQVIPAAFVGHMINRLSPEILMELEKALGLELSFDTLREQELNAFSAKVEELVLRQSEEELKEMSARLMKRFQLMDCSDPLKPLYPPIPPERIAPTKAGDRIPDMSGVYFVFDAGGLVKYVGQTVNLNARVRLTHPAITEQDSLTYLLFPFDQLLFAESYYIGICRPHCNFGQFQKRLLRRELRPGGRLEKRYRMVD